MLDMVRSRLRAVRGVLTPTGVLKSESKASLTARASTHQVSVSFTTELGMFVLFGSLGFMKDVFH